MIKEFFDQELFETRTPREQILLFCLGLIAIYFVWFLFLSRPLLKEHQRIQHQVKHMQVEKNSIAQQKIIIQNSVNDPTYQRQFLIHKKLITATQQLDTNLESLTPTLINAKDFSKVMEDILKTAEGIGLISLKKLPVEPLIPADMTSYPVHKNFKNIYKYSIRLQVQSTYFDTIQFLQRLEKLPWRLYWDSLQYRVLQYPTAEVTLKIHILSNQKSAL